MLAPGSAAVLVGMGQHEVSQLPLGWMLVHEISLLTTFRYANAYPAAIALAASGDLRLDGLIGARFPLEEAASAFNRGDHGQNCTAFGDPDAVLTKEKRCVD
jgi:L-iditol 2-dehydrogenase